MYFSYVVVYFLSFHLFVIESKYKYDVGNVNSK